MHSIQLDQRLYWWGGWGVCGCVCVRALIVMPHARLQVWRIAQSRDWGHEIVSLTFVWYTYLSQKCWDVCIFSTYRAEYWITTATYSQQVMTSPLQYHGKCTWITWTLWSGLYDVLSIFFRSPRDNTSIMEGIAVHVFSTDEKFKVCCDMQL